ncbi:hypothetical protein GUJ93_ZPchr0010g7381 [Zizania palustris]|uniref:Uncharacterized protein n=1 Tax=Zizania palustris TaxID=103762 RepID=A0A8J5WAB2_ZIZPA|nr:hypothetical protein GUJ93_ZPchr0010g7381 [Zizania palustris]
MGHCHVDHAMRAQDSGYLYLLVSFVSSPVPPPHTTVTRHGRRFAPVGRRPPSRKRAVVPTLPREFTSALPFLPATGVEWMHDPKA